MIAVLDASPLCYLLLIGEIDLLPQLFSRVVVPQAVIVELLHDDAPATVRNWASNLPIWISVEVRIPTNPITHSNRKAITIPSHADHFRSGATRACFIMRKRQRIVKPSAF
jgi:predicted nucleic acid-binding protein